MGERRQSGSGTGSDQIPVLRSPRYQEIYANGVRFRVTPIDFTMTLGSTPDILGAPPNIMQEEVSITLTHSFMKVLARHLNAAVDAIEKEIGPIRIEEKHNPRPEQLELLAQALKNTKFVE
jgi:hypothetical protein